MTGKEIYTTLAEVRVALLDMRDLARNGERVCHDCLTRHASRLASVIASLSLDGRP